MERDPPHTGEELRGKRSISTAGFYYKMGRVSEQKKSCRGKLNDRGSFRVFSRIAMNFSRGLLR